MFPNNEANRALAKRIFLNELDECLYFPKYFEIETVNACNARCVICSIKDWNKGKNALMNSDLFSKFVDEVSQYRNWIETISLARDGEPTLDPNLPLRVRMLKRVGIKKVTFSTNGQLLSAQLAEELIVQGLDDIMVSIDGITKETFEKIRVPLDYETVLKNTLDLIQLRNRINPKMTIRLRMVVVDENQHEVDGWLKYWSEQVKEQDRVYAMPLHTWGNQLKKERAEKIAFYADKPCVTPFSTISMHADGEIGLCGVDYNSKHLMGDFAKQSLKEVWIGECFSRVRELHANSRRNEIMLCRGCDLWEREYNEAEIKKF